MAFAIRSNIEPLETKEYTSGEPNKKWLVNGHVKELIELSIPLTSVNSTTLRVSDSRITSKHVVIETVYIEEPGRIFS